MPVATRLQNAGRDVLNDAVRVKVTKGGEYFVREAVVVVFGHHSASLPHQAMASRRPATTT